MLLERMGLVGEEGRETGAGGNGGRARGGAGKPWVCVVAQYVVNEGPDGWERGRRWLHNGLGRCQGSSQRQPNV